MNSICVVVLEGDCALVEGGKHTAEIHSADDFAVVLAAVLRRFARVHGEPPLRATVYAEDDEGIREEIGVAEAHALFTPPCAGPDDPPVRL